MKAYLFYLLFALPATLLASGGFSAKGGPNAALGGISATPVNAFSMHNNQGATAFLNETAFGLAYRSPYWPATLTDVSLVAASPLGTGTLGGSMNYTGNDLYYEMKAGVGYALRIADKAGIGVQLDYLHTKAQNYAGKHFVTFEVGVLYRPLEQLSIGAHVFNPVKYTVDEETGETLPIVMNFGVEYRPHTDIGIWAEVEKDIDFPVNVRGGLEYRVLEELAVRGGFSVRPAILTFGLGYELKKLAVLDVATGYHFDLGFNTAVSLSFLLKPKKEESGE